MLQTASPEPLIVLGVSPGGVAREAEIHARLRPYLLRGEWYHPVQEVHALLSDIQTPEFIVQEGRAYAVLRRSAAGAPSRPCPFCGEPHRHGKGDGHRVAHCGSDALEKVQSGDVALFRQDGYVVVTDGAIDSTVR